MQSDKENDSSGLLKGGRTGGSDAGSSDSGKNGVDTSPPVKSLAPGSIIKQGILLKKGRNKIYHPWVLRSFTLDDQSILRYYDGRKLRGQISLTNAVIEHVLPSRADKKSYAFEIGNIITDSALQKSSMLLVASSEFEMNDWIQALRLGANKPTVTKGALSYESFDVSFTYFAVSLLLSYHVSPRMWYEWRIQQLTYEN